MVVLKDGENEEGGFNGKKWFLFLVFGVFIKYRCVCI